MSIAVRILVGVSSLAVAGFCLFGFLASFESGVGLGWKFGFAAALVIAVSTAVAACLVSPPRT